MTDSPKAEKGMSSDEGRCPKKVEPETSAGLKRFPIDTVQMSERKDSRNNLDRILMAFEDPGSPDLALQTDAKGPARWSVRTWWWPVVPVSVAREQV